MKKVGVLFACIFASTANAGLITANTSIDLDSAITGSRWTGVGHALDSAVQVKSGDTITINIDFLGNQLLNWDSSGYFNPWLMLGNFPGAYDSSQSGSFTLTNLSVELLDLTTGSQFSAGQLIDHGSGAIHLGPTGRLGADNIARTFSGATLTFDAAWTDGDPYREFGTIGYYTPMFGGSVSSSLATSVPEPASIALLSLGLAGLGLSRKKKSV